jgi:aminoglycoside phosphotransferase
MADPVVSRRGTRLALTGHSGAELTLFEADGQNFVRKQARSTSQNARLAAQCDKLRRAHAAGIACPAVFQSGGEAGLFWFDMEYVAADSLAHALVAGREPDWAHLLPQIAGFPALFRQSGTGVIPAAQFRGKFGSIAAACLANAATAPTQGRISQLIARLQACDWDGIPDSDCHGDFTLENILLRADGRVVLIDFDVPEQSSWWLDIAKLFQDLMGHWCLRHVVLADPEGVEALNARLAMSRAAARMERVVGPMIEGGVERLRPLIAFHLMRTLPYARDSLIVDYVLQRVEAVLEE